MNYHSEESMQTLKFCRKYELIQHLVISPPPSLFWIVLAAGEVPIATPRQSDTDLKQQMTWITKSYLWKTTIFPRHIPKKKLKRCSARVVSHSFL